MLDKQMEAASERFIRTIKETEIYKKYMYQLEKIKRNPELFENVNEFRQRN